MQSQRPYKRGLIALSIWLSYHKSSCVKCEYGKCDYAQHPYTATIPTESRQSVTFNSAEDYRNVFLELIAESPEKYTVGEQLYRNYRQFACTNHMYDKEIEEMIRRYTYCKETGVPPFSGSYDDQPAWWLEVYAIINSEINAVRACECTMCKPSE